MKRPPPGSTPAWGVLARGCACSAEGGDAGDGPAHDQDVHLVGALVGADALEVVRVTHRRVLERDTVAAEDGPGLAGDGDRGPDVVELAERDLLRDQGPGVLHPADVQRDQ